MRGACKKISTPKDGGHIFIAWPWTGNDVFFKAVNFHTRTLTHTSTLACTNHTNFKLEKLHRWCLGEAYLKQSTARNSTARNI